MNAQTHKISLLALVSTVLFIGYLEAVPVVPAVWNSSGASGTLDGIPFSAGGLAFEQRVTADLTGSSYSYAPLASDQSVTSYWAGSGGSPAYFFNTPVEGLLLYVVEWNGGPINETPSTYTFSASFQVMSGFEGATVQGTTITVPDGAKSSGILLFRGPLSTLSITDSEPSDGTRNMMTIAQSPILFDADADGVDDQFETDTGIFVSAQDTGTSPANPDSDGDGLRDGEEVVTYHTNPNLSDTDGDGFSDRYEILNGKSPTDPNDKPALVAQASTAIEFTFPSATGKVYRIEASTNLSNWTVIESGINGTGNEIQRFYSTKGVPKRFLRVEESAP